jgi:uncharacterized protein YbbC (DUF1343 family)
MSYAAQIRNFLVLIAFCFLVSHACCSQNQVGKTALADSKSSQKAITGAEQFFEYLPMLKNKRVALVANHTSLVDGRHLVDTLRSQGVNIVSVFAPEHGFRGAADAGEKIASGKDPKTGLPVVSLYGENKKPTAAQLKDIGIVVFDIQDVGARFYTYISTLSYVMEACAEQNIPVLVLDRPNPNGHYFDGPILEPAYASFVGLHPVPIVHGMTVGEYANMVNGEAWLKNGKKCSLSVIPCKNWKHGDFYTVDVPPSPNLKSMNAIYLYPSLCLFEGTPVSLGRGTPKPFEVIGYPGNKEGTYAFTPVSGPGSKNPPYLNTECKGVDLSGFGEGFIREKGKLHLFWLLSMYQSAPDKPTFFTPFFDKLAGTDKLRKQIESGKTEAEIRASWTAGLEKFSLIRMKYLLYPEK